MPFHQKLLCWIERRNKEIAFLLLGGIFLYTCLRAWFVSLSHDEALSYLHHASSSFSTILTYSSPYPSNNHLLNSILMKISILFFGLSEFAVRLPALLGHVLYLCGVYKICRLVLSPRLQIAGMILLVTNPFLLDLFSCARGYALALGFLSLGTFYYLKGIAFCSDLSSYRKYFLLAGIFYTLSTLANLAFLHINLSLFFVIIAYECICFYNRRENRLHLLQNWKIFLSTLLPILCQMFFLFIVYLVPIIKLKKYEEFYYGGEDGFWKSTVTSLIEDTLYGRSFASLPVVLMIKILISLFLIIVIGRLIGQVVRRIPLLVFSKPMERKKAIEKNDQSISGLILLLGVCITAIVLQWELLHTKYVISRTASYFLPLFYILCLLFWQGSQSWGKGLRAVVSLVYSLLIIIASWHFLANANISYFAHVKYDASTKFAMAYLRDLNHNRIIPPLSQSIGINWMFEPSVNFYRVKYHLDWLKPVHRQGPISKFDYYYLVLTERTCEDEKELFKSFLAREKYQLEILQEYDLTDTILAVPKNR